MGILNIPAVGDGTGGGPLEATVFDTATDFGGFSTFDFSNPSYVNSFFIVASTVSNDANDGFTIGGISLNVVLVPRAAYMFPAALALFGFFGYRRRRNES